MFFDEDNELCENCEYYFGIVAINLNDEELLVCLGCKEELE